MTNNQKAFKEAEKELEKDRIKEIKDVMKSILQAIQNEKEKKIQAEENLRLLKLDMEDLRAGKIEKIKERHEKSKKAKEISPIKESDLNKFIYSGSNNLTVGGGNAYATWYADATSGTYTINCSNGIIKELNL